MKKTALLVLFLASCVSAEEARFNRLLNSIDARARPIRWVDEDVFMLEGMTLDWPLPPQGWSGDCLLFVTSPREGDQPELTISIFWRFEVEVSGKKAGNYAFVLYGRPSLTDNISVNVTSVKGQGGIYLSAYVLGSSVCREQR
ncbi:hypothetical protein HYT45_03435 [Candidatus Uhrbacteria bacterium]|nr:hypothetical protein [Candidatus Uhrbacteria bacterium]